MNLHENAKPIAAAIQAMGAVFNADVLKATYELFRPLQERAPKDDVVRHVDLAYGDDDRHRLDVFTSAKPSEEPAPIVIFVHGGGFIGGERSPLPGLIYDNVATFFAKHGCVGINATYRLAPASRWPGGGEDVGRMVAWAKAHAAEYGGDPKKIILFGHSAGAAHVAAWTFLERLHGQQGPGVAASILVSGVYSIHHPVFNAADPTPNQLAYYGADAAAWPGMATLGNIQSSHPPVYVGVAEFDPYPFAWPSAALAAELVKCDKRVPWMRTLTGHNHVSTVFMIDSEVDTLGPDLLQFVNDTTSPARLASAS